MTRTLMATRCAGLSGCTRKRETRRRGIKASICSPENALAAARWSITAHRFAHRMRYARSGRAREFPGFRRKNTREARSEEHTSELQSHLNLVCRLLLEKKKKTNISLFF